jgi:hypothetical protein
MDKVTELCKFLAWVQDKYTEHGDDDFDSIDELYGGGISKSYTRREVVEDYLKTTGGQNGRV